MQRGFHFRAGIVKFLKDLGGMFAEEGRWQAVEDGLRSEMDGIGDAADGIQRGVLDFYNQVARKGLWIMQGFGDGLDG